MIQRYARPAMVAIWQPETRFQIWFEIEAHATEALAKLGVVPQSAADALWAWWATLAGLMIAVACLLTSGIPLRRIFSIGWYLWLLLGIMAGYQLVSLLP